MKATFDLDQAKREFGHLVKNMRRNETFDVRIDRQTRWGNPFKGPDRRQSVLRYLDYAREQVREGHWTVEELAALRGKTLGCWCHPLDCHGHVLAWIAEQCWQSLQKKKGAASVAAAR